MKQLPLTFKRTSGEKAGYTFTQVFQNSFGYIYKVSGSGRPHYEVFAKRENKRFNCISYPTTKAFGIWAWCCMSLGKAKDRLSNLSQPKIDLSDDLHF